MPHSRGQRKPAHAGAHAQIARPVLHKAAGGHEMALALSRQARVVGVGVVLHQRQMGAFHLHLARIVEGRHLAVDEEQRRLGKAGHAAEKQLRLPSLRRAPGDVPLSHAPVHVQQALAAEQLARPLRERLSRQAQAHTLHVRGVDHAFLFLAHMGQPFGLLHGHCFIKAVHIGAAHGLHAPGRPFLQRSAHAQIAVGIVEHRLLQGELIVRGLRRPH